MTTLLDTRVVARSDRSDYWRAGIAELFFPIRVDPLDTRSFDARLTGGQIGALTVRSISGAPHRVARTQRMVADSDPESILLYLLREGGCRIEQDGRTVELRPGDIAIQDTSRPSTFEAISRFDVLVLSFPKWFIAPDADRISRRAATRVAGQDRSFARLVTPFVAALADAADGEGVSGQQGDGAARMLATMLGTLCMDDEPGRALAAGDPLARMQRYVLEHLHEPSLGAEQVARAHFVSTRYVHKLFSATGTGVAAWIRECRLDGALRQLQTTRDVSVGQVATHWGYRDPASFTRAFHDRFGRTPREVRSVTRAHLRQRAARDSG